MIFKRQKKKKVSDGFSLVEILVVMAIIGLLSTLAIAGVKYAQLRAMEAKALHDINAINTAIAILANDTGLWPGHQPAFVIPASGSPEAADNEYCGPDANNVSCGTRSLSAETAGITRNDSANPYPNWQGPYMREMPLDPWGREYFFDTDYRVDIDGSPEDCGHGPPYYDVVVVGSYGPDGLHAPLSSYSCDDIIKIILK